MAKQKTITDEIIMNKILLIRGQKVMIDRDLAELYGVSTKQLNQQVKRNSKRSARETAGHSNRRRAEPSTPTP